jgi:hypothetical protein
MENGETQADSSNITSPNSNQIQEQKKGTVTMKMETK